MGLASDSILVVQDFSQLQMNCGFLQTLIIVLYYFQDGELQTVYLDYVGDKGMKNDVTFLAGVWRNLCKNPLLKSFQKMYLWNDGGPKHFKITSAMHLWAWVKTTLGLSVLVENTFAPYHGHNVCDAVAHRIRQNWMCSVQRVQISFTEVHRSPLWRYSYQN